MPLYLPVNVTTSSVAAAAAAIEYDTKAALEAANVPPVVDALSIQGYTSAGDGGGAQYKRAASEPSHPGKIQSADGAWWELAEPVPIVEMFGNVGDDSTDNATALQNAIDFAEAKNLPGLFFSEGVYLSSAQLRIKTGLRLHGAALGTANTSATANDFATAIKYTGSTLSTGEALVLVQGDTNEFVHNFAWDGIAILGNNAAPIGLELRSVRFPNIGRIHIDRCTEKHFYINGKNTATAGGIGMISFISIDTGSGVATEDADGVFISEPDADIGVTSMTIGRIETAVKNGYGVVLGNFDESVIDHIKGTIKSGGTGKTLLLKTSTATARRVRKVDILHMGGDVDVEEGAGPVTIGWANSEPSSVRVIDPATGLQSDGDAAVYYQAYDRKNGQMFAANNKFPLTRELQAMAVDMMAVSGSGSALAALTNDYPALQFPNSGTPKASVLMRNELLTIGRVRSVRLRHIGSSTADVRLNITVAARIDSEGLGGGTASTSVTVSSSAVITEVTIDLAATLDIRHGSLPLIVVERDSAHADDTMGGSWYILETAMLYENAGPNGDGTDYDKWYRPWASAPVDLPLP